MIFNITLNTCRNQNPFLHIIMEENLEGRKETSLTLQFKIQRYSEKRQKKIGGQLGNWNARAADKN